MKKNSLTEGRVAISILLFALPLLGSSLIQQLYSTVDLVFVGQLLGTESAAAIGASDLLITCMVGFFNGMAIGTSVIASQLFGGKRWADLKRLIQTSFWIGIFGGAILLCFALFMAPIFLTWMGTPKEIFPLAIRYLRIYCLSLISVVLYNLLSGVVRALGDSRTPMLLQLFGGIVNVISDYIFIVVFKLGVEGTAMATFMSQTFAAICVVIYLMRMKSDYSLNLRTFGFDLSLFGQILRIGVPSGLQAIITTLSNILIQAQINTLGVDSIAAFTVYFKTEMILYLPILATGQALVSFVGQNYGANQPERIKKGFRFCIIAGSAFIFSFALILMFNAPVILHIFTKDVTVVVLGSEIMHVTFPLYFMCLILECLSSNLRGYGEAFKPMIVVIVSYCGFRIILLYTFMHFLHSVDGVALCYPLSWSMAVFLMFLVTMHHKKKLKYITANPSQ